MQCPSCSEATLAAFVSFGSYFTRCTSCGFEGPATSWRALSSKLQGRLRAVVVDDSYEHTQVIAEGEASEIAEAISDIAYQGKLVRLLSPNADA
jgi:uncharacterized Zn finger protein